MQLELEFDGEAGSNWEGDRRGCCRPASVEALWQEREAGEWKGGSVLGLREKGMWGLEAHVPLHCIVISHWTGQEIHWHFLCTRQEVMRCQL